MAIRNSRKPVCFVRCAFCALALGESPTSTPLSQLGAGASRFRARDRDALALALHFLAPATEAAAAKGPFRLPDSVSVCHLVHMLRTLWPSPTLQRIT